jgi:GNAT superfamily N-acetyltransferase
MVMSKYTLTLATPSHQDWILLQIEGCRLQMAAHGSGQWQGKEPSLATIEEDILHQRYYLLFVNNQPCGGASLMSHEPGYDRLLEGQWLNQDSYMVIHRFFIAPSFQGQHLSKILLNQLEQRVKQQQINNIRLDTHTLNLPMRGLLSRQEYLEVGKAWLPQAGERLVYHKVLGEKHGTQQ